MSNQQQPPSLALSTKSLFARDDVKQKFQELLGKRSVSFITSVLQIVASSKELAEAEPNSIYHSAAVAATLDLPLNSQLGFAHIVAYSQKQKDGSYKKVAQFQMGWKGFVQLAFRSGQFKTLKCADVRQGELKNYDRLTGELEIVWEKDEVKRLQLPVVGYASYFKLLNGFENTLFMFVDELRAHGLRYSQTFKKGFGLWKDDFDNMARKTVTKLNLSKNAPLSIEMQTAVIADQALINDADGTDVTYPDNEPDQPIDKEAERLRLMIDDCKTISELVALLPYVPEHLQDYYLQKRDELGG